MDMWGITPDHSALRGIDTVQRRIARYSIDSTLKQAINSCYAERQVQTEPMNIEMWAIDRPIDYPKNARKWGPKAIEKVGDSIKRFGFRQPIVVDKDGVIIIGHLRRTAARSIGLKEVPVHVASDLSPQNVRLLRLADNRTSDESDFDLDLLTLEFGELKLEGLDLSWSAFNSREIDKFTAVANPAEDEVPPLPVTPVTRLGDLWTMDKHRILCGDATDPASVQKLLGGGAWRIWCSATPHIIFPTLAEVKNVMR